MQFVSQFTRSGSGRANPFDEYDYYMGKEGDSPNSSDGICIELWFKEDATNKWHDSLIQALNEIIQTGPSCKH